LCFFANISRIGFDNALVRYIAGYRTVNDSYSISGIFSYALVRVIFVSIFSATIIYFSAELLSEQLFNKPMLSPVLQVAAALLLKSMELNQEATI
jgi:O-antigen/teichoic acid export membrane protein